MSSGSAEGMLGAPRGDALGVGVAVGVPVTVVDVRDEAGEVVGPAGVALIEALEAGVEADVMEVQLGATWDSQLIMEIGTADSSFECRGPVRNGRMFRHEIGP